MRTTHPDQLAEVLASLPLPRGGVCVVHSSLLKFGRIEGGLDAVLAMLQAVLGPDCTLAMPAFTFSYPRTRHWSWQHSRAETGALCEHFRTRPGTLRSLHPIHSLALRGPHAAALAGCSGAGSFGPGSPWELLCRLGAWNLALGTEFEGGATFLHHAEETAAVPYRFHKAFPGRVEGPDGLPVAREFTLYARRLDGPLAAENHWAPVWDGLCAEGLVHERRCRGARVFAMPIAPAHAWLHQRLLAQPMFCARPPAAAPGPEAAPAPAAAAMPVPA